MQQVSNITAGLRCTLVGSHLVQSIAGCREAHLLGHHVYHVLHRVLRCNLIALEGVVRKVHTNDFLYFV